MSRVSRFLLALLAICLCGFTITSLTVSTINGVSVTSDSFTQIKCANIDPSSTTTNWFIYEFEAASTITHVRCWVDASTSVVMTPRECDSDGANCSDIEAAMTCATTRVSESSSIDNATIDAGDTLRMTRGTVTGSPTQVIMCVTYTTP